MSAVVVLATAGCSTMSNTVQYSSTPTNVINIQQASANGANKVRVGEFRMSQSGVKSLFCRGMGEVDISPGQTPEEFIKESLQKELLEAGAYSTTSPVVLTGTLNRISFSSMSPPHWDLSLSLASSNGVSYEVTNSYRFKGSFDAYNACLNVTNAFTPAVQDLLEKAIGDPRFVRLIRR